MLQRGDAYDNKKDAYALNNTVHSSGRARLSVLKQAECHSLWHPESRKNPRDAQK